MKDPTEDGYALLFEAAFRHAPLPMLLVEEASSAIIAANDAAIVHFGLHQDEPLPGIHELLNKPPDTSRVFSSLLTLNGRRVRLYVLHTPPAELHTREERPALHDLLMRMATNFVNVPVERIDESITKALEVIGKFVRADRAYLFRYDFIADTMSNTHEWCAEGISREINNSQNIPNRLLPEILNAHRNAEVYVLEDADTLPPGPFKDILLPQGIKSLILFPMISGKDLLGFVGFDAVRHKRLYTDEEIALLRVLAEILANAEVRRRNDESLRKSEENFRSLVETISDFLWEVDANGAYTYASPQIETILGYAPAEVLGKTPFDLMPPDEAERVRTLFAAIVEKQEPFISLPNVNRHKDGRLVVMETSGTPVFDNAGNFRGYRGVDRDVTTRTYAERGLRQNEERYRALFDLSPAGIMLLDPDGTILEVNDTFQRSHQYTREQLIGQNVLLLVPPAEHHRVKEHIPRILSGETFEHEVVNLRKDGSHCIVELRERSILLPDGRLGVLSVANDITARKRAEDELREREHLFRTVVENAQAVIFVLDEKGVFKLSEGQALSNLGLRPGEVVGLSALELYKDYPNVCDGIRRALRGELTRVTAEVQGLTFDTLYSPYFDRTGAVIGVVGVATDITERKRAEERLRTSEERYRRFFEEDLTGIFITSPDGRFIDCNPAFLRIFGFASLAEAQNTNAAQLYRSAEQRQELLALLRERGSLENFEITLRRMDGQPVHILENVIGTFDPKGNLIQLMGYISDKTVQKQLERQLVQAQKMESLGTLASGIAHDFNNILGIILGHASLLDDVKERPDRVVHHAAAIQKATERGVGVVKQLLTFARKTEVLLESVKLNDVIGELAKLLRETFPKNITIDISMAGDIPSIIADTNQMHQVFLNLCVNARDAMPAGGRLSITTTTEPLESVLRLWPEAKAADYVIVRVSDSGSGMDEATRARIFEPFFTTKGKGKGTGLGLATVYGIVQAHKGFIHVVSALGEGTTFVTGFPVQPRTIEGETPASADELLLLPSGIETILVVEDEPMLSEMLSDLLRGRGYTVRVASNGAEAIDVYSRLHDEIHLVLSDLGLPKMGGDELYLRLRALNPGVKFIIASGFIDPAVLATMRREGMKHIVYKPYRPLGILQKVREVLDEK